MKKSTKKETKKERPEDSKIKDLDPKSQVKGGVWGGPTDLF